MTAVISKSVIIKEGAGVGEEQSNALKLELLRWFQRVS